MDIFIPECPVLAIVWNRKHTRQVIDLFLRSYLYAHKQLKGSFWSEFSIKLNVCGLMKKYQPQILFQSREEVI